MKAYCTQPIAVPSPALVPILTVWHNKPAKHPVTAAKEAIDKIGGVCERFALMDQPPSGGVPPHTYPGEFGPLYDSRGLLDGTFRLRDWMTQAFAECYHQGMTALPELLTLDHEALPTKGINWRDKADVAARARVRALCARVAVIEPAQLVWGETLAACNYEDREGIEGETDPNGNEYPAVGVGEIVCPVWYEAPVRNVHLDTVKARAAMTVARAGGREVIPWVNSQDMTRWAFEVLGVGRAILWGSGLAPSYEAQAWVAGRAA